MFINKTIFICIFLLKEKGNSNGAKFYGMIVLYGFELKKKCEPKSNKWIPLDFIYLKSVLYKVSHRKS